MRGFRSNAQGYAGISPRLSGPSMPEPEPAKGPGRPGGQVAPGRTRLAGSDQAEGSNGRAFYSFGNRDCRPGDQADQALPGNHTSDRPGTRTGPDKAGQGQGKASAQALSQGRLTHRRNVCTIYL